MKNREAGLVSIIVPVYRAAAYIADTIGMVFSQTYGRWELLLVDKPAIRFLILTHYSEATQPSLQSEFRPLPRR